MFCQRGFGLPRGLVGWMARSPPSTGLRSVHKQNTCKCTLAQAVAPSPKQKRSDAPLVQDVYANTLCTPGKTHSQDCFEASYVISFGVILDPRLAFCIVCYTINHSFYVIYNKFNTTSPEHQQATDDWQLLSHKHITTHNYCTPVQAQILKILCL